jgi:ABC-type branched-subunit amino acid transport system substrate-binding protein
VLEKDGKTVALELETGKNNTEQLKKNAEKLAKLKAQPKFIVTTNEVALNKAKKIIQENRLFGLDMIQVLSAKDFLKTPPV